MPNTLAKQYVAQKNNRTIRPICMADVTVDKIYVCRTALQLKQLERIIHIHEARVVNEVDCCQAFVKSRLQDFFQSRRQVLMTKTEGLLEGTREETAEALLKKFLVNDELHILQTEIKQEIQQRVMRLFHIHSFPVAVFHSSLLDKGMLQKFTAVAEEYRRTIRCSEQVQKIGNELWDKAVDGFALSYPCKKAIGQLELGSIMLKLVQCQPEEHKRIGTVQLARRISGLIDIIRIRLERELDRTIASVFYQLYDDSYAVQFAERWLLFKTRWSERRQPVSQTEYPVRKAV